MCIYEHKCILHIYINKYIKYKYVYININIYMHTYVYMDDYMYCTS